MFSRILLIFLFLTVFSTRFYAENKSEITSNLESFTLLKNRIIINIDNFEFFLIDVRRGNLQEEFRYGFQSSALLFGKIQKQGLFKAICNPIGNSMYGSNFSDKTAIMLDKSFDGKDETGIVFSFSEYFHLFGTHNSEQKLNGGVLLLLDYNEFFKFDLLTSFYLSSSITEKDEWIFDHPVFRGRELLYTSGRMIFLPDPWRLTLLISGSYSEYYLPGVALYCSAGVKTDFLEAGLMFSGSTSEYITPDYSYITESVGCGLEIEYIPVDFFTLSTYYLLKFNHLPVYPVPYVKYTNTFDISGKIDIAGFSADIYLIRKLTFEENGVILFFRETGGNLKLESDQLSISGEFQYRQDNMLIDEKLLTLNISSEYEMFSMLSELKLKLIDKFFLSGKLNCKINLSDGYFNLAVKTPYFSLADFSREYFSEKLPETEITLGWKIKTEIPGKEEMDLNL